MIISVILCLSVLLVKDTGENHRPCCRNHIHSIMNLVPILEEEEEEEEEVADKLYHIMLYEYTSL